MKQQNNETSNDTNSLKERVYYKGKVFILIERKTPLAVIQLESNAGETRTVEEKYVLSVEEFEKQKENRLSTHVNWTN